MSKVFGFHITVTPKTTIMILKLFLSSVCAGLVVAAPSAQVENKCPQPTPTQPTPGAFYYGHPDDCEYYFTCAHGNPTLMPCSPGTRWSDFLQTCVGSFGLSDTCTRLNAERECTRGSTDLIAHPQACQRYYNCSDTSPRGMRSYLGPFEDECPYPDLFDAHEKKCKPFTEAQCGVLRTAAKAPCDYVKNLCGGAHCQPCGSRLPSCVGLADGLHVHPDREWSPWHIRCYSERTEAGLYCGNIPETGTTGLFSPTELKCVSIWEVPRDTGYGLAPSCDGKAPGSYRTDERPDVYYTCPGGAVSYCGVGNTFNEATGACE